MAVNFRESEFTEEDYIAAVERGLGNSTYPKYAIEISRISQDKENALGYDGVLESLVPFYIQFKRSKMYHDTYEGPLARGRTDVGLPNGRGFFSFSLHKDRHSSSYDQHNALFNLSTHSLTAYVAPLFYKRDRLSNFKKRFDLYAWHYGAIRVFSNSRQAPVLFPNIRLFTDSISIPPHAEVIDNAASHHYSFDIARTVCFHSKPTLLNGTQKTFSEFMAQAIEKALQDKLFDKLQWLKEALPQIFRTTWESRTLQRVVKYHLGEIGLPLPRGGSLPSYLVEKLGTRNRLLLMEHLLKQEFNIIQLVVRVIRR